VPVGLVPPREVRRVVNWRVIKMLEELFSPKGANVVLTVVFIGVYFFTNVVILQGYKVKLNIVEKVAVLLFGSILFIIVLGIENKRFGIGLVMIMTGALISWHIHEPTQECFWNTMDALEWANEELGLSAGSVKGCEVLVEKYYEAHGILQEEFPTCCQEYFDRWSMVPKSWREWACVVLVVVGVIVMARGVMCRFVPCC